ncbi:MAG TPA: hypothetical protein VNM69_02245 [Bacillus sp. (in: firmicutes)]|nr:hypothetical protein [Bacillus sp. (in: firmicutes)]
MKTFVVQAVLFFLSLLVLKYTSQGNDAFVIPIILLVAAIIHILRYKKEPFTALSLMTATSALLSILNSKIAASENVYVFSGLLQLSSHFLIMAVGFVSFVYLYQQSKGTKKRKFKVQEEKDYARKMKRGMETTQSLTAIWKNRKEEGIIKPIEQLFEKKEEQNNAINFVLGTEVDHDSSSYEYEKY